MELCILKGFTCRLQLPLLSMLCHYYIFMKGCSSRTKSGCNSCPSLDKHDHSINMEGCIHNTPKIANRKTFLRTVLLKNFSLKVPPMPLSLWGLGKSPEFVDSTAFLSWKANQGRETSVTQGRKFAGRGKS